MNGNKRVVFFSGGSGNLGRNIRKYAPKEDCYVELSFRDWDYAEIENLINSFKKSGIRKMHYIHSAWPVRDSEYLNSKSNVEFLEKSKMIILWLIDNFDIEICGIGSILEVGSTLEVYDNTVSQPENVYAECKAELHSWLNVITKGRYKWLRIANQYSRYDPSFKLIPQLLNQNSVYLKNPYASRDFIHVSDSAKAVIAHIGSKIMDVSLISTGNSVNPLQIAAALGVEVQYPSGMEVSNQQTFPMNLTKLKWLPQVNLNSMRDYLSNETLD